MKGTITVRLIKSFEYRNVKNMVIQNIELDTISVLELKKMVLDNISNDRKYRVHKGKLYDTLKIYTHAFGNKTQNLVINMEDDEKMILSDDSKKLSECGIGNESELSFFVKEEYLKFKKNPVDSLW